MTDQWLARSRAASSTNSALASIYVASELADEGHRAKIAAQLRDLAEELVFLHRQLLELPPERTPAGQEFSQADLSQDDVPF